ncbi:hypothetical protein O3G_MSEX005080 [Manduca sexta]|uniref:Uncharacterized protein n=1 Tax=Manduca sexta TaxID=7130 RepID=A0A921YXB7_MANSE|nr:hypothetical protein O3G_MSEX005080 [Manduca sexta]
MQTQNILRKYYIISEGEGLTTSKSLASGLETSNKHPLSVSNFDLSKVRPHLNGSNDFLDVERQNIDREASSETLVPKTPVPTTPILSKKPLDEFKANVTRIDSHHSNLEALGRSQNDLNKFNL